LKHLQKCIQTEKDGIPKIQFTNEETKKLLMQLNNEVPNVSLLKTKESCIAVMCKYDIGLEANIDDMIMGPHLKVMLQKERDTNLDNLAHFNEIIHKSPDNNRIIELKEQIKLEQAENERLRKKLEDYQLLVEDTVLICEDNKYLEKERASHNKTRELLEKYKSKVKKIRAIAF
jgi:hypothetical protein